MANILMAAYTNYRRDPRVRREAEALVEEGHEVTFLASQQEGEPSEETIQGVKVRKLSGIKNSKTSATGYIFDYGIFLFLFFFHCLRHFRKYDLVHVNNMPDFLVFGALVPRILGKPVIHDVHDLMPELYMEKFGVGPGNPMIRLLMLQERWAGKFASAVLTVEDRLRETLVSRGVSRDKISVLMNLPDDRVFRREGTASEAEEESPFLMVYHGTLARRLGLDVAVHAIGLIRSEIGNAEFRIIGAGEERENLVALRDQLGLGDVVTFSDGFVPVEQIPALIADAHVGLVPLRASEGTDIMLPTKLLEYVFMGIPAVVPRTGTITRYFDEEMVAFFNAGDPESLAMAILDLYKNPEKRNRLALTARRCFGRKYAWREHRKIYTALVCRLLNGYDTADTDVAE